MGQEYSLRIVWDFPGGPLIKVLPSDAGRMGLIPDWGAKMPGSKKKKKKKKLSIKHKQYCNTLKKHWIIAQ